MTAWLAVKQPLQLSSVCLASTPYALQVFSGLKGTQLWQTDLTGHWKQVSNPAISANTDDSGHVVTIAGTLDRYLCSCTSHLSCKVANDVCVTAISKTA